jgi:hypothetical protein
MLVVYLDPRLNTSKGCGRGAEAQPALGDGDDDQDDEQPGAVASSTSDAMSGT